MGLDWNPLPRPRPGHEQEFAEILGIDLSSLDPSEEEAILDRFAEISSAPYEVLGAPQVGIDPAADDWLGERLAANGSDLSLSEAKEKMHGYYVLDLVPANPGLPMYTSRGYEGVDRYTFRGSFLNDFRDLLGEELFESAWSRMDAIQLRQYGKRLLQIARRFASRHGLEHLEDERDPPAGDEGTAESRSHILFAAAKWCIWWAERGHGMEPYY